jgi:tetratricopeptide (TPR) repeat protein
VRCSLVLTNLAEVLWSQSKYEAAEEMHLRALEITEKVLGPEHPDTLPNMHNLAVVLRSQGKYEAAEEMYRRAPELRQKVLGPEHPDSLMSMNNLAVLLSSQAKYEAAKEMHRRALEEDIEKVLSKATKGGHEASNAQKPKLNSCLVRFPTHPNPSTQLMENIRRGNLKT